MQENDRELAESEPVNTASVHDINRLSDHLFFVARHLNVDGANDVLWVPCGNR